MNYGLPYMGSKNRIAQALIDVMPKAHTFVDLFAGGCAVTHAAMLSGKYSAFIANDIDGAMPRLFLDAINGKFKDENRWISREDFEREKTSSAYVRSVWSFGNNGRGYMYSKEVEPWKKALHYARMFDDRSLLREFGIDSDGSHADIIAHHDEYKLKYVRWYVENVIDKNFDESLVHDLKGKIEKTSEELRLYLVGARDAAGLTSSDVDRLLGTNGMAGHYFGRSQWEFPTRENYDKMRTAMPALKDFDEVYGYADLLQSLERLESLQRLQSLQSLQSLQRLQSLQSLERLESLQRLERLESLQRLQSLQSLQSLERLESLEVHGGDYRAVEIPDDAVVYCDIPYRGTAEYVVGAFDHDAFYEWALSRPFRVFVSEYSMPSEFSCVWDIAHRSRLSAIANNRVTEKLFCNKPMPRVGQLDLFAGVA